MYKAKSKAQKAKRRTDREETRRTNRKLARGQKKSIALPPKAKVINVGRRKA